MTRKIIIIVICSALLTFLKYLVKSSTPRTCWMGATIMHREKQ
jgi:ABC-type antimicrobial peptide transport system permease subunit